MEKGHNLPLRWLLNVKIPVNGGTLRNNDESGRHNNSGSSAVDSNAPAVASSVASGGRDPSVARGVASGNRVAPDLITSTRLRKYLATVTQVLQLDDNQLEWVANHLGHNLQVHRQFYRLPSEVLQLAKVSQLLLASEQGQMHKYQGMSLDDLNVEGKCM